MVMRLAAWRARMSCSVSVVLGLIDGDLGNSKGGKRQLTQHSVGYPQLPNINDCGNGPRDVVFPRTSGAQLHNCGRGGELRNTGNKFVVDAIMKTPSQRRPG